MVVAVVVNDWHTHKPSPKSPFGNTTVIYRYTDMFQATINPKTGWSPPKLDTLF